MALATVLHEHAPAVRTPAPPERLARASIRGQIARLEQRLSLATWELWQARALEPVGTQPVPQEGPRLMDLGELEATRDALVAELRRAERRLREHAHSQACARDRLDAMLAEPAAHRYAIVHRAALGEPSCGAYHVVPRFGLLGMLFGWWCVKLSSGCP
jgi:hypothetical protein